MSTVNLISKLSMVCSFSSPFLLPFTTALQSTGNSAKVVRYAFVLEPSGQ